MSVKLPLFLSSFVGLLFLASCASGPKIYTDYDPAVDFSQYKTFGFFSPLSIEGENYSTLFGQAFRTAIGREMRALGYVESDDPDLSINVSARLSEKTDVTVSQDPHRSGHYYGYRRGFYDPWMDYRWGTTTHVNQYTEGTVNVDIVDTGKNQMVWEGVAIGRLKENRSNAEIRAAIDEGVASMFAGYKEQVKPQD
jgi:hypothetical protein